MSINSFLNTAITELGACFSNTPITNYTTSPYFLIATPQISSPVGQYLSDTLNWMEVSGKYKAMGGEQYITIGNFNDDAHTDTIQFASGMTKSYYYIDDVSVIACDTTIQTDSASSLIVPNAFTPNGDGTNDVFKVISKNIKTFDCKIYNRWGTQIAELKNASESWDGKNATAGVYYYIISAEGIDEKQYNQKGFLELVK